MAESQQVRWGVLGAARINERMLPAMARAGNARLAAVASRRPEAAAALAAGHPGARACAGYEELLADPEIDAVYLPLPNHLHAEWAVRAAERGKHVLCEKPLALTVAEAEAVAAAARARGVHVMEGFMYRFHPQHERVWELIRSGVIGEVRVVRASYSFLMGEARRQRAAVDVEQGGGAMWDIGSYAVSTLRWLFGAEPQAASARARYAATGADLTTGGVLDFGGGRLGIFDASFECARRSEYEVTGTRGGVRCHRVWQHEGDVPEVSWWTDDGGGAHERLAAADHFVLEIEEFSAALLAGRTPRFGPEDAAAQVRALRACLRAAREGVAAVA